MNKKRLLLFAYFYPPLGGPSVQRPLKLVKYMSQMGWDVDVITVGNITFHSLDKSLAAEDRAANVYRTNSFDPMSILNRVASGSQKVEKSVYFKTPEFAKKMIRSLFIIDDKIGWYPFAFKQAVKLCRIKKYNAVMATMGPFTSGVVAANISKKFKIPLIADFRDYWTQNAFLPFPTKLHRKIAEKWEKKILNQSLLYTTIGHVMGRDLADKYNPELLKKNYVMYNGWDEEDFVNSSVVKNTNKVVISYLGTLYSLRTPKYFMNVLKKLKRNGELADNILFRFVGNFYSEELEILQQPELSEFIELVSQVEHDEAIELMMQSDALLFFNPTLMGEGLVSGKVFEYLKSGKHIFSMIAPKSEIAEILKSKGHDLICEMESEDDVELNLLKLLKRIDSKTYPKFASPEEFSRKYQTKLFLEKLESCLR